ncbi:hypothetical protein FPRO05_10941 [Fusarium proliferatum]|uniref:Asparaginase n=1 Tax=Gibberella intermedia TaxID=948311 RepID=A0A365NAT9_GIBIN|nr:hypothetical protein FPRO05_10941 [Fusarium proliferatum]
MSISGWKLILVAAILIAALFTTQTAPPEPRCIEPNCTPPTSLVLNDERPGRSKPTVAVLATGGTALGKEWDGSLLGSIVDFRPEIFNAPRDIPKTFDIQGLEAHDKVPRTKYFHPMMEEEEFDRALQEGVEAAVLGVYDDGYFPERLTEGLKKLTDQVGFIAAAVSYGHTFDVRRRIDGVVPASDWTDRMLMMMMPFVLSSNMTWEKRMEFIAEPYVKNERASCATIPTRVSRSLGHGIWSMLTGFGIPLSE